MRQFREELAGRFQEPFIRLLIMDWRFAFLLGLAVCAVAFAVFLPMKVLLRSPKGFVPEVKVSLLDLIQARALAHSARKAEERSQWVPATYAWEGALGNDPCNRELGAKYLQSLFRTGREADRRRALAAGGWLLMVSPRDMVMAELFIKAADQNRYWEMILDTWRGVEEAKMPEAAKLSHLRALFFTSQFDKASAEMVKSALTNTPSFDLYRLAVKSIQEPGPEVFAELEAKVAAHPDQVEALEAHLVTFAVRRELEAFEKTLEAVKRITDHTLPYDLLHARLMMDLGRRSEAIRIAERFGAPRNSAEMMLLARGWIALGRKQGALEVLRKNVPVFPENNSGWYLYAHLLLEEKQLEELREVAVQIKLMPRGAMFSALAAAADVVVDPTPGSFERLKEALRPAVGISQGVFFFASLAAATAGHPAEACEILLMIEAGNLGSAEFYRELFTVADAARDTELMRRAARRWHTLAPGDLMAVANHAAMLVLYEEEAETAAALTAHCLDLLPDSVAAQINHAAALLNAGRLGSADLLLEKINASAEPAYVRNQLLFVKMKRAVLLGDKFSATQIEVLMDKSDLYPMQRVWLEGVLSQMFSPAEPEVPEATRAEVKS